MKNLVNILKENNLKLFIVSIVFLASCSTTNNYTSGYDDVYYNKKDASGQPESKVVNKTPVKNNNIGDDEYSNNVTTKNSDAIQTDEGNIKKYAGDNNNSQNDPYITNNGQDNSQDYSNSSSVQDSSGNTYITNNYYDYEYASRIRRFHNPGYSYNYYDDYYTNSYWYNYDPFYWGTSIYMGYNWMYPSYCYYRPSWYFGMGYGMGWGYGGYGFGFGSFYSPYAYGWGGYNPYWGDYGYYYYNSYDRGNNYAYHYNGRQPLGGSSNHRDRNTKTTQGAGGVGSYMSFGQKYQNYIASANTSSRTNAFNTTGNLNNGPGKQINSIDNKQQSTFISPMKSNAVNNSSNRLNLNPTQNINKAGGNELVKPNLSSPVDKFSNTSVKNNKSFEKPNAKMNNNLPVQNNRQQVKQFNAVNNNQQYSKPVTKYSKPGNINAFTMPQKKYTKPNYSGPKAYSSPGYSQPKSGQYYSRPGNSSMPGGSYENRTPRYQSAPSRSYNSEPQRSYSSPVQRQPSYSSPAPSRSYSSPAPSRSYSSPSPAPSRSYSSPAPSSGSSRSSGGYSPRR